MRILATVVLALAAVLPAAPATAAPGVVWGGCPDVGTPLPGLECHGVFLFGTNTCGNDVVTRYLVTGLRPPPGTTCGSGSPLVEYARGHGADAEPLNAMVPLPERLYRDPNQVGAAFARVTGE